MRIPIAAALLGAALTVSGCSGQGEPRVVVVTSYPEAATETPTPSPTSTLFKPFFEPKQCRADAQPVIKALRKASKDKGGGDGVRRLEVVDGLMPQATAQCTAAVTDPIRQAIAQLDAILRPAETGKERDDGTYLFTYLALQRAQTALDSTR